MTKSRSPVAPLLFTSGYLVAWTSRSSLAFAVGGDWWRTDPGDLLAAELHGRWIVQERL